MNQSILFPDRQHWDEERAAVCFPAQQAGALIECVVSQAVLESYAQQSITSCQHAIELFEQWRFDLEEQAESLIEDEMFNSRGEIELNQE